MNVDVGIRGEKSNRTRQRWDKAKKDMMQSTGNYWSHIPTLSSVETTGWGGNTYMHNVSMKTCVNNNYHNGSVYRQCTCCMLQYIVCLHIHTALNNEELEGVSTLDGKVAGEQRWGRLEVEQAQPWPHLTDAYMYMYTISAYFPLYSREWEKKFAYFTRHLWCQNKY